MAKQKPTPSGIVEQLRPLAIPISSLTLDAKNARAHSDKNLDSIKASLTKFGQRKPIVVQKEGMIVRAGNGTVEAAKAIGWTEIAAVIIDDDDSTATAFGLADNRTAELAEWNWQSLGDAMRELDGVVDLTDLGWDEQEIENLMAADWTPPPEPTSRNSDEDGKPTKQTVKFSEAQWRRMEEIVGTPITAKKLLDRLELTVG